MNYKQLFNSFWNTQVLTFSYKLRRYYKIENGILNIRFKYFPLEIEGLK